jgi:tetratricopeptide (TPR) repeat protein
MKFRIISFIFALLSFSLNAAESRRLIEANQMYTKENFKAADSLYQLVLNEEGVSAAVYYNLGNTKYKLGEIAPAILNYERALKLDPNNEDILFNLEMAQHKTTDKIEHLDKFFLEEWNKSIQGLFSSDGWSYLTIICFIALLTGIALYFFGKNNALRKIAFFGSILLLFVFIISFVYAKEQKDAQIIHDTAIIFAPSVTCKGSPDAGGTDLFLLHEGTKVNVKSKLNGWVEIQMMDGNVGWIPEKDLEII